MASVEEMKLEEARSAAEELLEFLQELHYQIEAVEDFDAYGVKEALLSRITVVLQRYEIE